MGFDRMLSQQALIRTHNQVDDAMSLLLSGNVASLLSDLGESLADAFASIEQPAAAAAAAEEQELSEE